MHTKSSAVYRSQGELEADKHEHLSNPSFSNDEGVLRVCCSAGASRATGTWKTVSVPPRSLDQRKYFVRVSFPLLPIFCSSISPQGAFDIFATTSFRADTHCIPKAHLVTTHCVSTYATSQTVQLLWASEAECGFPLL